MIKNDDFRVLTTKEEEQVEDLCTYYAELRKYLAKAEYAHQNKLALKIKEKLNILIKKILNRILKYAIIIDGLGNVPAGPVIYASSHQDFYDVINSIYANPEHCLTLNASNIRVALKCLLSLNGVIFIDRDSKESRQEATIEMEKALAKGKSVNMYPEATLNCTPSKLHLPFNIGMIRMAKRMNVPIIPVVQEYTYDETKLDGKTHVKSVHIVFGEPIYVKENDDIFEKLEEYDEKFSTLRWGLIEEKGSHSRDKISNKLYTNYIKTRIRDWRIPNNDIYEERKQVFGSSDDRYLFYHVNDVDFDENDNLLPTEYVRKLIKINQQHGI